MVFESFDMEVLWGDGQITINRDNGQTLDLFVDSIQMYTNGEANELLMPIRMVNDRAMISYLDAGFLFDEGTEFSNTIMTTVLSAFGLMDALEIPGFNVAIVDAETGFTWTQGFGLANSATNEYINENTKFNLGSIAKTFTAMAVMQLVEDGLIDLDTPIVEYLPQFRTGPSPLLGGDSADITVRHLLTHTSGIIPNFIGHNSVTVNGHDRVFFNSFLDTLSDYFLISPPGEVFVYNNNGYNVLGILVAALTGGDDFFAGFERHIVENILAPAGMNSTTFITDENTRNAMARPYLQTGVPAEMLFINSIPTGNLVSTASDMATFMKILLNDDGALLNSGTISYMMQPHDFNFRDSLGGVIYGLGFFHSTSVDGISFVGHNGSFIHYNADMLLDVETGIGVFVSSSSLTGLGIAQHLANTIMQTAVAEKAGSVPRLTLRADANAVPIEATDLERHVGVYIGMMDYYIVLIGDSGNLYMDLPTAPIPPLELIPMSDGSFISPLIGRLWFEEVYEEGETVGVIRQGDLGFHMIGARIDAEDLMPSESFMSWIGTFAAQPRMNEVSLATRITFGVDANGFAYQRAEQIMGINPTTPVVTADDAFSFGVSDTVFNAGGMLESFTLVGMPFVRVAQ